MFFQKQSFIAIDLETTGIDFQKDKIIEFAGVLIENGKVIKKLELLINPEIEISPVIQSITGISNQDVSSAPIFSEVKSKIQDFISDKVLLGHNIEFDITFLRENGIEITQKSLDTYTLSSIFFTEEKSLALEVLSETLQIEHKHKHRALGDILATVELLKIIYQKIQELDLLVIQQIQKVLQESDSALKILFSEVISLTKDSSRQQMSLFQNEKMILNSEDFIDTELEKWQNVFLDSQAIILENAPQSRLVTEALNYLFYQDKPSILAFYSPKLLTKTINSLDSQFFSKVLVLKNIHNYLCLQKWSKFLHKQHFTETELILVIKIIIWLNQTTSGDRDEITLTYAEYPIWQALLASNHTCTGSEHKECYWQKTQHQISHKPIIITYQSLLLESCLPEQKSLLVCEARDLEKSLTMIGTKKITKESILEILDTICQFPELQIYQSQINVQADNLEIFWGYFFHTLTQSLENFQYAENFIYNHELKSQNKILELHLSFKQWLAKMEEVLNLLSGFVKLKFQINYLQNLIHDLKSFLQDSSENEIRWIQATPQGDLNFFIQKIDLKPMMHEVLQKYQSIICLDENLGTVSGLNSSTLYNLDYWKNSLGVEKIDWKTVCFPQASSAKPKLDLSFLEKAKNYTNHFDLTCSAILETVQKNQGKTLVLFSSYSQIHEFTKALALDLQALGYKVLAQGNGGGNQKIKAIFEKFPSQSVIFGIERSFHREFFYPENLKSIILTKLIFDLPNDPLLQARQSYLKNPFLEFALPRAILNFKQTYLKLKSADQSLIVLDPRLIEKEYGKYFIQSLKLT